MRFASSSPTTQPAPFWISCPQRCPIRMRGAVARHHTREARKGGMPHGRRPSASPSRHRLAGQGRTASFDAALAAVRRQFLAQGNPVMPGPPVRAPRRYPALAGGRSLTSRHHAKTRRESSWRLRVRLFRARARNQKGNACPAMISAAAQASTIVSRAVSAPWRAALRVRAMALLMGGNVRPTGKEIVNPAPSARAGSSSGSCPRRSALPRREGPPPRVPETARRSR